MVECNPSSLQLDDITPVYSSNPALSDDPAAEPPAPTAALLDTSTRDEPDTPNTQPDRSSIGCFRNMLRNLRKTFFNGYIPENLYATDFKLLFILTAIYTSLIFQFRQTGNQEVEDDVDSGGLFKINSVWTNNSISG